MNISILRFIFRWGSLRDHINAKVGPIRTLLYPSYKTTVHLWKQTLLFSVPDCQVDKGNLFDSSKRNLPNTTEEQKRIKFRELSLENINR